MQNEYSEPIEEDFVSPERSERAELFNEIEDIEGCTKESVVGLLNNQSSDIHKRSGTSHACYQDALECMEQGDYAGALLTWAGYLRRSKVYGLDSFLRTYKAQLDPVLQTNAEVLVALIKTPHAKSYLYRYANKAELNVSVEIYEQLLKQYKGSSPIQAMYFARIRRQGNVDRCLSVWLPLLPQHAGPCQQFAQRLEAKKHWKQADALWKAISAFNPKAYQKYLSRRPDPLREFREAAAGEKPDPKLKHAAHIDSLPALVALQQLRHCLKTSNRTGFIESTLTFFELIRQEEELTISLSELHPILEIFKREKLNPEQQARYERVQEFTQKIEYDKQADDISPRASRSAAFRKAFPKKMKFQNSQTMQVLTNAPLSKEHVDPSPHKWRNKKRR